MHQREGEDVLGLHGGEPQGVAQGGLADLRGGGVLSGGAQDFVEHGFEPGGVGQAEIHRGELVFEFGRERSHFCAA